MRINTTKILNKIVEYGDHLSGHSARRLRGDVEALKRFQYAGPEGVPHSTIRHATELSDKARASSTKTRVNTALGVIGGGGAGFLGIHKYHQHKDNEILKKIDRMSRMDYNQ